MSSGCIKNSRTSLWGALGCAERLDIPRSRAKAALRLLEQAELLKTKSARVRHIVECDAPEYAWLPQTLLYGAGDEVPPIRKLRETQDVLLVRLLIELYGRHELADEDGLPLGLCRRITSKTILLRRPAWTACAFTSGDRYFTASPGGLLDPVIAPHLIWPTPSAGRRRKHEPEPSAEPDNRNWFGRIDQLVRLGLLKAVPRLMEGPDADAGLAYTLWPYTATHDVEPEVAIGDAATCAADAMIFSDNDGADRFWEIEAKTGASVVRLAIPAHMTNAELVIGYRLTYRPHTKATSAWLAELAEGSARWTAQYQQLAVAWGATRDQLRTTATGTA